MKEIFIAAASLLFTTAQAQYFNAQEYDWEEAAYETITGQDSTDKYVIQSKSLFNYYYTADDQLSEQYLYHRKYQVNSDDAIESSNRIYVSATEETGDLLAFKARVINPSGKVVELTSDDWLSGKDEETEREYTYVALEGVERGSQVEYFHIREFNPSYSGVAVTVQGEDPVKHFELDIISPANLQFDGRVYRMDTALTADTSLENENRLYLRLDSVPMLRQEPSSFREPHLIRVVFKLDNNLYTGRKNVISYSNTAQNVINAINREWARKEEKSLKKISKSIGLKEGEVSTDAIRKIENFLKENYQYLEYSHPDLTNVESIYENKAFNQLGALKVYTQLFKNQGINYQLAYTCDRSEKAFDVDFETNYPLDELLLYFPEQEEFIDMTSPRYRFGCISPYLRGQPGLFIDQMKLGENTVGVAQVEDIPAKPYQFTMDTILVEVNFGEDLYDNSLAVKRILSGYHAQYYQPLFELVVEKEDLEDIQKSILNYIDTEAEVEDLEVENGQARLLGIKPLVVSGQLESANFVEKAGTDYLFKVGKLIGPQSEMYQETEERKTDVSTAFTRAYHRVIRFEIPEGYEVANLADLKMTASMDFNEQTSALFTSDYVVKGREVEVTVWEFYEEVSYPKEVFEDYRRVINAAADFNKITLLLKKVG
ncbi:MAG: DUF3857 domain-containing protein [Owenweeksia sp.]|nr:DUF3857 domain-containing protein [Owenweeksia sp.]